MKRSIYIVLFFVLFLGCILAQGLSNMGVGLSGSDTYIVLIVGVVLVALLLPPMPKVLSIVLIGASLVMVNATNNGVVVVPQIPMGNAVMLFPGAYGAVSLFKEIALKK